MQEEFTQSYGIQKNSKTQELYIKLIEEEHEEWVEEYYGMASYEFNELKELADLVYVTAGYLFVSDQLLHQGTKYRLEQEETWDFGITKMVSELAAGNRDLKIFGQLIYCCFAYADAMGWNLNEAYRRVHVSNMSKLGDDGKPIRREDGKILKGPNYKLAYLEDLTDGK